MRILLSVLVVTSVYASAVTAQGVLEEILVTAQKREENLQDVPVSVTAFSGEAVRELGFENSTDIVAHIANLSFGVPVGEGNTPVFAMRGVGLSDLSIIKAWEAACARHPTRRVRIWSLDQHLQGYDRGIHIRIPVPG